MLGVRALAFYAGYTVVTILFGSLGSAFGWALPFRLRFNLIIVGWARTVLAWLRLTCNVRISVEGLHHVPKDRGCIVLSNHESSIEALVLQCCFAPAATVVKRELLMIPFFGWTYWMLKPISINRNRPIEAFKEVLRQGKQRLLDHMAVVLFPEGTRGQPGELRPFHRSGAALAVAAAAPVVPVFHDSGRCWPARTFLKYPGNVRFVIGPPIETTGQEVDAVNQKARDWVAAAQSAHRAES